MKTDNQVIWCSLTKKLMQIENRNLTETYRNMAEVLQVDYLVMSHQVLQLQTHNSVFISIANMSHIFH